MITGAGSALAFTSLDLVLTATAGAAATASLSAAGGHGRGSLAAHAHGLDRRIGTRRSLRCDGRIGGFAAALRRVFFLTTVTLLAASSLSIT
jgi:hypothetical protein